MEARFILPVSTMLAGLGLWIVYLVARASSGTIKSWPVRVQLAIAAVTGGLVVFSGFA